MEVKNCVTEIQVCDVGLSDKEASYLQVQRSKLGRFYLLPKIHKGLSVAMVGQLFLLWYGDGACVRVFRSSS